MKHLLLVLSLLTAFSAQANDQDDSRLYKLQRQHRECIIKSGEKTYAKIKLQCGQKVDYDATNKRVKEACDVAFERMFKEPQTQEELNLQRDFRSSVYSVSYAVLNSMSLEHSSTVAKDLKRDCAIKKALVKASKESNFEMGVQ